MISMLQICIHMNVSGDGNKGGAVDIDSSLENEDDSIGECSFLIVFSSLFIKKMEYFCIQDEMVALFFVVFFKEML